MASLPNDVQDVVGFPVLLAALLLGIACRPIAAIPVLRPLLMWNPRHLLRRDLAGAGLGHAIGMRPAFGSLAYIDSGLVMFASHAQT